jgi:hypothetical protein
VPVLRFSILCKKNPITQTVSDGIPFGESCRGTNTEKFIARCDNLLFASVLCACSGVERLNDIVLNPDTATQEKARRMYEQSVADYRECLAANPANACDGQRQIMEADERALSAAVLGLKAE